MSDRTLKFILLSYFLLSAALLQLTSCSFEAWRAPMALPVPVDTVRLSGWPTIGKLKFTGPVTITTQHGTGNVATARATDNTKAGQRGGAAATAPGATATSRPAGTPWWVYGGLVAVGVGSGAWAGFRLRRIRRVLGL